MDLEPRKAPKQARARDTERVILEAATRVLHARGPDGFTTNHVAEVAGVSIGSLYQYYPNKLALLARVQADEVRRTLLAVDEALAEPGPAHRRLRRAVRAFFRTELEEAELRRALAGIASELRTVPGIADARALALARVEAFLAEAWAVPNAQRAFLADLCVTTIGQIAEDVTARLSDPAVVEHWADVVAAMLGTYLASQAEWPLLEG